MLANFLYGFIHENAHVKFMSKVLLYQYNELGERKTGFKGSSVREETISVASNKFVIILHSY
jgi:hypothetical protein